MYIIARLTGNSYRPGVKVGGGDAIGRGESGESKSPPGVAGFGGYLLGMVDDQVERDVRFEFG
jgi:hypothetical protein